MAMRGSDCCAEENVVMRIYCYPFVGCKNNEIYDGIAVDFVY